MMVGRCRDDIVLCSPVLDSHWLYPDRLSSKCGFATSLDPHGGGRLRPALGRSIAKGLFRFEGKHLSRFDESER